MTHTHDAFERWWESLPQTIPTNSKSVAWMGYLEAHNSAASDLSSAQEKVSSLREALEQIVNSRVDNAEPEGGLELLLGLTEIIQRHKEIARHALISSDAAA